MDTPSRIFISGFARVFWAGGRFMSIKPFLKMFFLPFLLMGCTGIPEGLRPVTGFEVGRYLGKWYEIARLDHSFERNLNNVTAQYSPGEGDQVLVLNRGFDKEKGKWQEVEGVARFIEDKTVGSLKVSFFGPFWGGYHVIALDREGYRYSMVSGPSRSYLWILSREKRLDEKILADLIGKAKEWGFETEKLIFVAHDGAPNNLPILRSWSGDYPVSQLDRLPEGQRTTLAGYLGTAAAFAEVWQAFTPGEEPPEVDFSKNLVVFSRNVSFYNRTSIAKVVLKDGVVDLLAIETRSAMPIENKVGMAMAVIPREGVRSIQAGGKQVPVSP
jgi:apolipoprotein D and lipocalin family protein